MSDHGGLFGAERIQWFNGGLFDGGHVLPLMPEEIATVDKVSRLDWSQVEPAIFGTLFERGLDPSKRSQLGAHYTDRAAIIRLIEPVLMTPLRRDFETTKIRVEKLVAEGRKVTARTKPESNPVAVFNAFLERLGAVRVLDPACGSGNFLYLALQALKDLEREAILWGSLTLNIPMQFPEVGPQAVLGIELNSYAAELARVVIWIGRSNGCSANGFAYARDPILQPLNNIECRDAILDLSEPDNPREPEWPRGDGHRGQPTFSRWQAPARQPGRRLRRCPLRRLPGQGAPRGRPCRPIGTRRLGRWWRQSTSTEWGCLPHRVFGAGPTGGFWSGSRTPATSSWPGPMSRGWLRAQRSISRSWATTTALRRTHALDGEPVNSINPNLTAGLDLTKVRRLKENRGIAFMGDTKGGPFDIPGIWLERCWRARTRMGVRTPK